VLARVKPLAWPVAISVLAAAVYTARISKEMVDFDVYRTAATRALHAEPLYRAEDGHYEFKYLPAFALAMTPFALVREDTAKVIWYAVSVGLLMALVRWSVFGLPSRHRSPVALTWITVIFMAKFYAHELTLGQANILLGALLVAALLAVQIDRPVAAGVLVGAAAFVKPYALIMLPWLAASYSLAAVVAALGVLAFGLVLPAAAYGWTGNAQLITDWWHTVRASTVPNLTGNDNISFAAMWTKWLGQGQLSAVLAAATGALAVGLAILVWRRRHHVADPEYLEWSLLMLLIPLLSPQGWDYVLLLGTPAVVCMADRWRTESAGWRVFFAATLAVLGLTVFDLMGRALYGRFMALSVVTVAAIAVLLSLAHLRARRAA
jgi:hypothetical protein